MYDNQLGRWHGVDKLAEKYISESPYDYVGNNPILRIDKDGRDWGIIIDHAARTITITGQFTYNSGMDGTTMQEAADNWNGQSGKFSYVIGKGEGAVSYSISFDVQVTEMKEVGAPLSSDAPLNNVSVLPDNNPFFAERKEIASDGTEKKIMPAGVSNGKDFALKESQKKDAQKTAHEMGHNLGMSHTTGLMGKEGGKKLAKPSVTNTLSQSGFENLKKGPTTGAKNTSSKAKGEAPKGFNVGSIQKNKNWDGPKFNK